MTLGAGSLAAAAADTWGTEIGTLSAQDPRLITSGRRVPAGTSGGVTAAGLTASAVGAIFVAAVAALLGWPGSVARAALLGGITGALADSLLGALWQARRRCPVCNSPTERTVHGCGARTVHASGLSWLDNDGVNFLSGGVGAGIALLAAS